VRSIDRGHRPGGFRALCRGEDVDLGDRLNRGDVHIEWDADNPVATSD
jgi:hypothetical protein